MDTPIKTEVRVKTLLILGIFSIALGALLFIDLSLPFNSAVLPDSTSKNQRAEAGGPIDIEIIIDYESPTNILSQPDAQFISLHFKTVNIADGDYFTLADENGNVQYTYPEDDFIIDDSGGVWASLVFGETIEITLHSNSGLSSEELAGYKIEADYYNYGIPSDDPALEDIQFETQIGGDDKRDIECYSSSDPDKYAAASPVALLYNTSGWSCTAFRVGPDGHMLTNEHYLTSSAEMSTTEIYFNFQHVVCDGTTIAGYTKIWPANLTFIQDNPSYDYALFQVINTTSIDSFGYYWLDTSTPITNEEMFIPQHPGGAPKMFGLEDTENGSGVCEVDMPNYSSVQAGYTCDTAGGSSGSPVVAYDDGKVVALHHAWNGIPSDPMNLGIRIEEFWSEIDDDIRPRTVQSLTYPGEGITIYDNTPNYLFPDENMADDFRLWISHNTEGVIYNEWVTRSGNCTAGACDYTPPVTHPYGQYQVMFQTRNAAGSSDWSSLFNYNLGDIPAAPTLASPSEIENYIRPNYYWSKVDYAEEYKLFVSHAAVGTMINEWVDADTVCGSSMCTWHHERHLRTGNHSWWIAGRNGIGTGPWSSPTVFKIWNTSPPTGSVTKDYPLADQTFPFVEFYFIWIENERASWYKVYMTDSTGKLYNQYHRAADICAGIYCVLEHDTYAPLIHAPRGLTELPTNVWIHWNVMPVNVDGNGIWTGLVDFWITWP